MNRMASILVVDDDPVIGTVLRMMLEYKGFAVIVLEKAEQINETMFKNSIDLLILDMIMPGVNGIDICTRLKKDNASAHLPVIMISAFDDAKKICLKAGADDFISKPFEMQNLFSKINNLIGLAIKDATSKYGDR